MREITNAKTSRLFHGIVCALALAILAQACLVIWQGNLYHYEDHLNSDIAAEAMLARGIAKNDMHVPETWIGSSETRVFSTANLGAFIYRMTGSMNRAMGWAVSAYFVIVCFSMYLFLRAAGLRRWIAVLTCTGAVTLTGSLEALNMYATFAGYYDSYICVMFLMFALYAVAMRKHKASVWIWLVGTLLAVASGLEGLHVFLMCFLPLAATALLHCVILAVFRRRAAHPGRNSTTLWAVATAIVNYAVIHFSAASSQETTRNIRHSLEKFITVVWPQVIEIVSPGRSRFLLGALIAAAGVGFIYLLLVRQESPAFALLCAPMSVMVLVAAGTFTTADSSARYYVVVNFAIAIGAGALIAIMTSNVPKWSPKKRIPGSVAAITVASVMLLYSLLGVRDFRTLLTGVQNDMYASYAEGLSRMREMGYERGYTSFDYANLLTGLSDGEVIAGNVDSFETMRAGAWLTDRSWYPPYVDADEETVYIVSDARLEEFRDFTRQNHVLPIHEQQFGNLHFIVLPENYIQGMP